MGLAPRSTVTTKVLQKVVWAGANNSSYPLATEALLQLAEVRLSPKQVRRLVGQVGRARLAERDEAVAHLREMTLPKRRAGNRAAEPPSLAVVSMDGGRYQRRDNFRNEPTRQEGGKHWRETKVGCLLSMESEVHQSDPAAEFPEWLASSKAVAELAKISEKAAADDVSSEADPSLVSDATERYEPPKLLEPCKEVLASGVEAEEFGWQLESRGPGNWAFRRPADRRLSLMDSPRTGRFQRRHFLMPRRFST